MPAVLRFTGLRTLIFTWLVVGSLSATVVGAGGDRPLQFNRDVRPILSANCFQCHGPDAETREADLRLDTEEGIQYAFEPGSLDDSEGWLRINSEDEHERMPPVSSHLELKFDEIELLKAWIQQGAAWQGHWSFVPPVRPAIPPVGDGDRVVHPIDAFILARLEEEGLSLSAEAQREILLRRVTLDLTGLPPTLEEIDAFLGDTSPQAYEKVVDRLLGSAHFGERMAVAWMDVARYGDTSVFHADGPRQMWPWRDWVIAAYNDNKRFDQFTIEQLAGDLLPDATLEQKIATGFNRNNATTDEGGAIAEEFRVEYAVDRVKTTSMAWLGLTMECAQCHEHKYDPISQEEYYQFYAYFNQAADPGMQTRKGNQTPLVQVPDFEQRVRRERLAGRLAELRQQIDTKAAQVGPAFDAWLVKLSADAPPAGAAPADKLLHYPLDDRQGSLVANAVDARRTGTVQGTARWSQGRLAGGFQFDGTNFVDLGDVANFERSAPFSYGAWLKPQDEGSGAAIARMDDAAGHRGYDLFLSGGRVSVHLIHVWPDNAIKVTTNQPLKPDQWQHVFVTYNGSSQATGIKIYVDGQPQPWTASQDRLDATIQTDKPLTLGRRHPGSPFVGQLDDVRFYGRALSQDEVESLMRDASIFEILAVDPAQRTDRQLAALREHFLRTEDESGKKLYQEVSTVEAQLRGADYKPPTVMVMRDVPQMRMTYVLDRGSYDAPNKDQPVQPGVPAMLPPLASDAAPNRLGLARWLVRPDHPLTPRVTVNRYWQMLFGTGLVKTAEDFGSQGDWPSHPDLLDWLAVDFVEHGWDIKRTLKQMVMSATYRQSSRATRPLFQRDAENRLLARGPRFRLDGEFIRDTALAASGLLVPTVGGAGVKPYQPPGLWNEVSIDAGLRFSQDHGDKLYRRSMYTYWKRSAPAPSMAIFDVPTRDKCTVRRARTNTPLQALVTLNDPQFVEAARTLAQRVMQTAGAQPADQIAMAYRLATGMRPTPAALQTLTAAYHDELAIFEQDAQRAERFLGVGEAPRDAGLPLARHAAMTVVASMILNLDATLTRG